MSGRAPLRRRWWAWAALGIAVVALVVLGANRRPPTGTSPERLIAVASNLKCLQCVGESVAGSQAPIAQKMRREIREQAQRGATDDEIYTWFADRYGKRVLLNPPSTDVGALIWVLPVVVSFLGLGLVAAAIGRWRDTSPAAAPIVDAADEALVAQLRHRSQEAGADG